MESKIRSALKMENSPVAVIWSDEKPEDSMQFKEGRWGCVVSLLNAAAKGRTACLDRKTFGCLGGGVGVGFGNQYENFPGGIEYFLSNGNPEFCQSEAGKKIVQNFPALEHGEKYIKTPLLARDFVESLPFKDVPAEYVVLKPLEKVTEEDNVKTVVFLVNPDQISALTVLANYGRKGGENVFIPFGAGCHTFGIFPYREGEKVVPRAVLGLTDVSARTKVGQDKLSFAVPLKMFLEMEDNVEESFLTGGTCWKEILKRN